MEARTASLAWAALYPASDRGRTTAFSGAHSFGLSDKRVLLLLARLPDAARCERFCEWPGKQDRPPVPALVRPCPCAVKMTPRFVDEDGNPSVVSVFLQYLYVLAP